MKYIIFLLFFIIQFIFGQFNIGSGGSSPWLQPNNRPPPLHNKQNRPPPNYHSNYKQQQYSNDDPIQPYESSYDTQQILPSKLPIQAPNGVIEIYNRVIDDLIKRLEVDFKKKSIDPMDIIIRSTPPGPVRVPGHLQKRPFRRPGAALYRGASLGGGGPAPPLVLSSPGSAGAPGGGINKRKSKLDIIHRHSSSSSSSSGGWDSGDDVVGHGDKNMNIIIEKPSFRGVGKINKIMIQENEHFINNSSGGGGGSSSGVETTLTSLIEMTNNKSDEISSEEIPSFLDVDVGRSDEFLSNIDELDDERESRKNKKKKDETEEDDDDDDDDDDDIKDKLEGAKDVDTLIQRYQNKNTENTNINGSEHHHVKDKPKYSGKKKGGTPPFVEKQTNNIKKIKTEISDDDEDVDDDDEIHPHYHHHQHYHDDGSNYDIEPGTSQNGGERPNGGYYPQGGPPVIPPKPNANLIGLSKIRRSSDVAVSVDARSAIITARLLVGPLDVIINESIEPQEKNIKATIPELEAELLLMERHGVVFLQRFTLDRAYGQDIEISIPKSKNEKNKNKKNQQSIPSGSYPSSPSSSSSSSSLLSNTNHPDPNHPSNIQQRFQTKMAAHISMEIVKLLRSGNLRVNLMRVAQNSMSKLKLPIVKNKINQKKSKSKLDKGKKKNDDDD